MSRPVYIDFSEQAQSDLQDLLGLVEDARDQLMTGEAEVLERRREGDQLSSDELRMVMQAGLRVGALRWKQLTQASSEIIIKLGLKPLP